MNEGLVGRILGGSVLVLLLALYGVGGRFSPYVLLALAAVAIPYLIVVRAGRPMIPDALTRGFALGLALLITAFALSASNPTAVLIASNFAWPLLVIPIGSLMKRMARLDAGIIVGRLALTGVALMLAFALYQRLGLEQERIGRLTSDPIRMANVAVVLGSLSLIGIAADRGRARWLYVLGPLLAAMVAFLAGTRGAMLGEAVIVVLCTLFLVRRKLLAIMVAIGLALAGGVALYVAAQLHIPRLDTLYETIRQMLSGETVADGSASIRLEMVRTSWAAFLDSPWFGHGWQNLISAVTRYLPAGQEHLFDAQPQLHSDVLNFAVAGGALGLAAYATMVLTPVMAALVGKRDRLYRVRLFGAFVLTVSYGVLGVSTLMFGFEQPTALFAGLAAIILGFCREPGPAVLERVQGVPRMAPPGRVEIAVTAILLLLVLSVSTIAGLLTPYIVVVIGVVLWLVLLVTGRLPESYRPFAGRSFLIAFALLGVIFATTMRSVNDVLFTFNFVMLLLAGPFLLLFSRASERTKPATVALLASAGVLLTLAMVGAAALGGNPRPSGIFLSQIILSNATLALAVVATTGAMALRSRWSLLLPLMLVVAVAVAMLTQSRGPLIAVIPLLILTAQFLWRTRLHGNGWLVLLAVVGTVVLGVWALQIAGGRITHLPRIIASFFGGESIGDATTDIRLALYRAGWQAVLEAPWLGHGWARLMSAPLPFLDPAFLDEIKKLRQLHNDVLNFGVAGGAAGVLVFILILLTPLIAALRSPRDALRPARLYGTAGLALVYAGGGLTDLMFGQEFHTMFFIMVNAIVLGLFREPPTAPGRNTS